MNTEQNIVKGIGEGHVEVMGTIEAKAVEVKSLADGLEILVESIDDHFTPAEECNDKSNGLLALLYSSIESIKTISGDIQELSNNMGKALAYRMKQREGKEV